MHICNMHICIYALSSTYEDEDDYNENYEDDDDEYDDVDLLATVSNAYAVLLSLVDWGSVVYQPCLQINGHVNMNIIRITMII